MTRALAVLLLLAACGDGVGDAVCGDGVSDEGEQCDDGNDADGDGCSPVCLRELCGNDVLDPGERCDDGNRDPGDGCGPTCGDEACGNGVVDLGTGEECDDADLDAGDGCSPDCRLEFCGNGALDPGEACDDGNLDDGDACRGDCGLACGTFANADLAVQGAGWTTWASFIDDAAPGAATPGELRLPWWTACDEPYAYQTICVPPYADAGLQAIAVAVRADYDEVSTATLSIGRSSPQRLASTTAYAEQLLCLGEAGYGSEITVSAGVACGVNGAAFDDFAVRPATLEECAEPGTVRNGDLALGDLGWAAAGAGVREIVDDGGDPAIHLRAAAATCEAPRLTGSMSPPLSTTLNRTALELVVRGSGATVRVQTGANAVVAQTWSKVTTSTATTVHFCVDAANRGRTFDVDVSLVAPGTCAGSPLREAWIDDLRFVTDLDCP